jgi:hypothetical protein
MGRPPAVTLESEQVRVLCEIYEECLRTGTALSRIPILFSQRGGPTLSYAHLKAKYIDPYIANKLSPIPRARDRQASTPQTTRETFEIDNLNKSVADMSPEEEEEAPRQEATAHININTPQRVQEETPRSRRLK